MLHWVVINNDTILYRLSTTETKKQVFLNGFQKQFFLGFLHFHVQFLPSIILNSDLTARLMTHNIYRFHGKSSDMRSQTNLTMDILMELQIVISVTLPSFVKNLLQYGQT